MSPQTARPQTPKHRTTVCTPWDRAFSVRVILVLKIARKRLRGSVLMHDSTRVDEERKC